MVAMATGVVRGLI